MEEFIKFLESNPNLIIEKCKANIKTFEDLEADVVIDKKILCPTTALELATVFEEYVNTSAVLLAYEEINIPSEVKENLIDLILKGLGRLKELATAEANNNGNLALFIKAVTEEEPIPNIVDSVTVNDNMISINFRSHEEEVVGSV